VSRRDIEKVGGYPHTPSRSQLTEKGEAYRNEIPVGIFVGLLQIHVSPCTRSPTRPAHFPEMNLDGYEKSGNDSTVVKKEKEHGDEGKGQVP
jgi:hypothetical protein